MNTQSIIDRHVQALFERAPVLCGFLLQRDLHLAEVSVFTASGCIPRHEQHEEVVRALLQLAEECPEALQLMRGRTFARVLQ